MFSFQFINNELDVNEIMINSNEDKYLIFVHITKIVDINKIIWDKWQDHGYFVFYTGASYGIDVKNKEKISLNSQKGKDSMKK